MIYPLPTDMNEQDQLHRWTWCACARTHAVSVSQVTGEDKASQRDWGTVGACCAASERGASILRVHNARGVAQALAVSDAIRNAVAEGSDA